MSDNDSINDDIVSQAYEKLPADNPPSALDDAILAASRREVNSRPQSLFTKWKVPISIAAVLTLSVSVVFTMYDQYGASLWKDDIELVSYGVTDSSDVNFVEAEALVIEQIQEETQKQAVVVLEDASIAIAAAGAPATIIADEEDLIPAPSAEPLVAADGLDMQKQSRAVAMQNIEAIKQKEQALVTEISEMQSMQEELLREKQEITHNLHENELKRNEANAKVAALTKKVKAEKASELPHKQSEKVKLPQDLWLEKINSLWNNDNKELARIELNRYLESKNIDKAKLKGKLPSELLKIDD